MAKDKENRVAVIEDALNPLEQRRIAEAEMMMRKKNKHYRPIPKFRGGCKNC